MQRTEKVALKLAHNEYLLFDAKPHIEPLSYILRHV